MPTYQGLGIVVVPRQLPNFLKEKNADITEVDEDYCTINDQIVKPINFDYRSDQEA